MAEIFVPRNYIQEKDDEIASPKKENELLKARIPGKEENDFRISEVPPLVLDEEREQAAKLIQDLNDLVWHTLPIPGHDSESSSKRHQMIEAFGFCLTGHEIARYT